MSHPQEPPRSFFPFGNPFRMLSPKGSNLSPSLLSLLSKFETTLAERFRTLIPKDKDDVLTLSWMKMAMESLRETHNDIKTLITDLELPVSDWDEKWIDVYLDISVNLLDICIAFTSELTRVNQGHLFLQSGLHKLESNSHEQFLRGRHSLDSWRQHVGSKNPRIENCHSILNNLVKSLNLPKVKNSSKGKVLMRALYGVKVETVYVCSVFAAAFSGSEKNLLHLDIPDTLLWGQEFLAVQTTINSEIRNVFSSRRVSVLKELDAVAESTKTLYPMIEDEVVSEKTELFKSSVADLGTKAEKLSQGLDLLTKEVDGFFRVVLSGRDALLCNLRSTDTVPKQKPRGNTDAQRGNAKAQMVR